MKRLLFSKEDQELIKRMLEQWGKSQERKPCKQVQRLVAYAAALVQEGMK